MPMVSSPSARASGSPAQSLSAAMRAVEQAIAEVARLETPILLIGERGTGKSTLARTLHEGSHRAGRGFRKISCGTAIAENFASGAERPVFLESGTLFLEDLSQLSAGCQDLLVESLRCSGPELPRLVSSTTRALEEEVQKGRFREDLFFRLNGVSLWIPPLRQRQEDILPCAEHYAAVAAEELGRTRPILSAWTRQVLQEYSWPGNLLELETAMRSLVVLGDEQQALAGLQARGRAATPVEAVSLKQAARAASREAERELILKVLGKTRWNRRKAAEHLQISYKALLYKLKQIGVEETTGL